MGRVAGSLDEGSTAASRGCCSSEERIVVLRRNTLRSKTACSRGRRNQETRERGVAPGISSGSSAFRLHLGRAGREPATGPRIASDVRQSLAGGDTGGVRSSGGHSPNPPKFAELLSECRACGGELAEPTACPSSAGCAAA